MSELTTNGTFGFKLVGDNIDFTVNTRYMRIDGRQNRSLHYFHCFAIQDRIDFSRLAFNKVPLTGLPDFEEMANKLLPSKLDDAALARNIAILLSRLLATHVPFFKHAFSDVVTWHIEHEYTTEMSQKSEVVSYICWWD